MIFFVKQKTAYEMRISDWSSDVCSSDLEGEDERLAAPHLRLQAARRGQAAAAMALSGLRRPGSGAPGAGVRARLDRCGGGRGRLGKSPCRQRALTLSLSSTEIGRAHV